MQIENLSTDDIWGLVFIIIVIILFYIIFTDNSRFEKKWNNGICKKTGAPWILEKREKYVEGYTIDTYTSMGNNIIYKLKKHYTRFPYAD